MGRALFKGNRMDRHRRCSQWLQLTAYPVRTPKADQYRCLNTNTGKFFSSNTQDVQDQERPPWDGAVGGNYWEKITISLSISEQRLQITATPFSVPHIPQDRQPGDLRTLPFCSTQLGQQLTPQVFCFCFFTCIYHDGFAFSVYFSVKF